MKFYIQDEIFEKNSIKAYWLLFVALQKLFWRANVSFTFRARVKNFAMKYRAFVIRDVNISYCQKRSVRYYYLQYQWVHEYNIGIMKTPSDKRILFDHSCAHYAIVRNVIAIGKSRTRVRKYLYINIEIFQED